MQQRIRQEGVVIEGYRELREHARQCPACLGDLTLAIVSLRVCGELRFTPNLCPDSERLLTRLAGLLRTEAPGA